MALLRRLVRSSWRFGAKTLHTAVLALVCLTGEYCTPLRCHSACTHLVDKPINKALHTGTGCPRPIPLDNVSILAGNQPSGLRHSMSCELSHGATICFSFPGSSSPDTHLCLPQRNSCCNVRTSTPVRHNGRITSGTWSGTSSQTPVLGSGVER